MYRNLISKHDKVIAKGLYALSEDLGVVSFIGLGTVIEAEWKSYYVQNLVS